MKEPVTKESKTRRKFDRSFKEEAVAHWLQSSKSAQAIAQELGINANQLYLWKKSFAPEPPGGKGGSGAKPSTQELAAQIEALRKENEHLRQQRDILKKTLGILSEPSRNASSAFKP